MREVEDEEVNTDVATYEVELTPEMMARLRDPREREPGIYFETDEEFEAFLKERDDKRKQARFDPLFTSDSTEWETPDWFFRALHEEFHFTLDAAASMDNRKVRNFFSIHQDAFRLQWRGKVWLNPPYGRGIGKWLAKAKQSAVEQDATVVVLVPARTDTNWWFDHARFGEVRFLKGRLKFEGAPTSAPFPSALVIFRPGLPRSTTYWDYKELKFEPFYVATQLS